MALSWSWMGCPKSSCSAASAHLGRTSPGGGRKAESLGSHTPVTATSGCLTKHRTDQKKNLSKGNENTAQVYDQQSYHLPYTGLLLGKRLHYFSEWEN